MAKSKVVIMPQPPYSSDLAPAEFFLFPKLRTPMKGKRFATIEEMKEKSPTAPGVSEVFRGSYAKEVTLKGTS